MDRYNATYERNCMLIVDDDFINRGVLQNIFSGEYSFEEAENGKDALDRLLACPEKFCAILLDVNMPEMNGIELLRIMHRRGLTESIPTFLITANDEIDVAHEAYELGVMDVINKPVVSFIILRRVQSVVELFRARESLHATVVGQQQQLRENADTIDELHRSTIEALASAIEFRDTESGEHTNRIYSITKYLLSHTEMGEGLSAEEIENIAIGSIMHDLGKISISDMILSKPGRLTSEEFEIMKQHTTRGAELMQRLAMKQSHPAYSYACDIAWHHHERWDGGGYPEGLKGNEITVWSQVVSIADVYDALISPRVYKKPVSPDEAVEMIVNDKCGVFNPKLLKCFLEAEPRLRSFYSPDANLTVLEHLNTDTRAQSQKRYFDTQADENRPRSGQVSSDILLLMSAVMTSFDMIICSNLTRNSYYMMNYDRFLTHCADNDGVFDDLIHYGAQSVPESHRQRFIDSFSREKLLKDHAEGRNTVVLKHPQHTDDGSVHMVKTTVVLLEETRTGDVIDLTFAQYIDDEWQAGTQLRQQLTELDKLVSRLSEEQHVDLNALHQALQAIIKTTSDD